MSVIGIEDGVGRGYVVSLLAGVSSLSASEKRLIVVSTLLCEYCPGRSEAVKCAAALEFLPIDDDSGRSFHSAPDSVG